MAYGENVDLYCEVKDVNAETLELTGDDRILVRYYSTASCTMEAASLHPINEDLYIIRNGNNTAYSNLATFDNVESPVFTFSAENSEGYVGRETIEAPMVNYVRLSCNIENGKPDASGNMDLRCSGYWFNGSFGKVNNTLRVYCRYGINGTYSEAIPMTIYSVGNSYTATASFNIENFNYKNTYQFVCEVEDELEYVMTDPYRAKSLPVFHWDENDFQFEVPVNVNGDVSIEGTLRINGEVLGGGDSGSWTPSLNASAVSKYSARKGWYSVVGNIVTVGFYIKATCNSGYDTTKILVSGLPFKPVLPGASGGICSGAYVSAGFNFQCFVAETAQNISIRVQSCNHSTAGNLSTSASGCWYPSGGGELTLGGTITYTV